MRPELRKFASILETGIEVGIELARGSQVGKLVPLEGRESHHLSGPARIVASRSAPSHIPRPVAISVTNVRSDGMSTIGMSANGVAAQPLLVIGIEQLDKVEHRTPRASKTVESGMTSAIPRRRVRCKKNQGHIFTAFV